MTETDAWSYEGITTLVAEVDPLRVESVHAVQKRPVGGGGDYLHRRVTLREENRIGPADGGSPDHRELDSDTNFGPVGIVTSHRDGPLTETAGVAMAEVGWQVDDPLWYWEPIENVGDPAIVEADAP